jgi:hypothetical protein
MPYSSDRFCLGQFSGCQAHVLVKIAYDTFMAPAAVISLLMAWVCKCCDNCHMVAAHHHFNKGGGFLFLLVPVQSNGNT